MNFNQLLMAILMLVLFFLVNEYIPLAPIINLLFNCVMIAIIVVYVMQFIGVIKSVLPAPKLFK
ncbi:hypothetical protein J2N86_02230 [Legionella lytica]|uniref:Uncharacterized protein n=1 Tax=Legionella lytica TaxID=96232 RepID=A0ABY4Y985_9GAMM|nr:Thivi_2564 family membrane protein [Legionella lytica]USQ14172.1 hypothetical protein J2N86_02230 [Legionella lytica]